MHPLVQRQLQRFFKNQPPDSEAFRAFAQAVSEAYRAHDEDRALLENSLALASQELEERYRRLQQDIAERERAQGERDAFYRASPDMLSILGPDLRILQVNPSWTRVLGLDTSTLEGTSFLDTVHPEDAGGLAEAFAAFRSNAKTHLDVREFEFRQRTVAGEWRNISLTAALDAERGVLFAVGRDVTQQRAMARELEQTHRLEAVGQLASGMAHEINTPIQYVGDNVHFARDGIAQLSRYLDVVHGRLTEAQREALRPEIQASDLEYLLEELPRSLSEAGDGVRRVAELVRALKEFAHPDHASKVHADVNRALERAIVMARGELRHVSRVETNLAPLPPLRCHIGSLSQVFLNLLINAAHAIEERSTKGGIPMAKHKVTVASRVDGDEIVVSISDTGCGIPSSIRERIYEPFFTTKPMGKGSGQGLPLVRNVIVGKHGGRIELDTEVNVGTTFTLRLPLDPCQEDDERPTEHAA